MVSLCPRPCPCPSSECGKGIVIDLTGGLEAALLLESHQGILGPRAEHAVGLADIESLALQLDLHLADLAAIEIHGTARAATFLDTSARRSSRNHRDDLTPRRSTITTSSRTTKYE